MFFSLFGDGAANNRLTVMVFTFLMSALTHKLTVRFLYF
jgi:hypothetical protein